MAWRGHNFRILAGFLDMLELLDGPPGFADLLPGLLNGGHRPRHMTMPQMYRGFVKIGHCRGHMVQGMIQGAEGFPSTSIQIFLFPGRHDLLVSQ